MLARILTDTITSRPPHCVLGARYDGNVNLFYVVMTGFYQTEIPQLYFPVQTLYQQQSLLRRSDAKDNPREELVWVFEAIRWLALKQDC